MARDDKPTIEFSVRVVEGGKVKFESSIVHPLFLDQKRQKLATEGWLELMASGLKLGRAVSDEETDT